MLKSQEKLNKELQDGEVLILFSGIEKRSSADEYFPFCVDKHFYYYTQDDEANDVLVVKKLQGKVHYTMFILPIDPIMARWVGQTHTKEEIMSLSQIEDVRYISELEEYLKVELLDVSKVLLLLEEDVRTKENLPSREFKKNYQTLLQNKVIEDVTPRLRALRNEKTEEEISDFKKAVEITNQGILSMMRHCKPGMMEYQMESYFDQTIKYLGAMDFSFKTIVASGANGCVLHYSSNQSKMEENTLVLCDLGANYHYMHADITRTFPVSGKFTERQAFYYQMVLNGQKLVTSHTKPGVTTRELNQILVDYYATELMACGKIHSKEEVRNYYFHGVSHHIGLDTHDDCEYKALTEGCIISCEPGLYISDEEIGIRIEDDLLITKDGCINLSQDIIKEIQDIEDYMEKYHD